MSSHDHNPSGQGAVAVNWRRLSRLALLPAGYDQRSVTEIGRPPCRTNHECVARGNGERHEIDQRASAIHTVVSQH